MPLPLPVRLLGICALHFPWSFCGGKLKACASVVIPEAERDLTVAFFTCSSVITTYVTGLMAEVRCLCAQGVAINFVREDDVRILRDIEQYYSTQIDEMVRFLIQCLHAHCCTLSGTAETAPICSASHGSRILSNAYIC